jgi:hypothetical protein
VKFNASPVTYRILNYTSIYMVKIAAAHVGVLLKTECEKFQCWCSERSFLLALFS